MLSDSFKPYIIGALNRAIDSSCYSKGKLDLSALRVW